MEINANYSLIIHLEMLKKFEDRIERNFTIVNIFKKLYITNA